MAFPTCGPRPRNAAATRASILEAAQSRFSRESYDDVGMRDIAGDAGVDPALIVRYFGSKEGLFRAALDHCHEGSTLLEGDRATFGTRIAHEIVYGTKSPKKMQGLQIILRSASSAKAMEVIQQQSCEQFMNPLTAWIGGDHGAVSARMAAALMMGMTVSKEITGGLALSEAECRSLEQRLARILQDIIDGA
ncbi:TetR/AcrR family transcriptional regulator [Brevundimonas sp.]|uniref:TetR/AcrR family transcriptional regulator n=1 Tax=Brevundimonas sp. TaxID=1871086 RepID=UPI0025C51D39|nr:TetR/AcrR family transcriptional regulator [Brevundimonas sp.]